MGTTYFLNYIITKFEIKYICIMYMYMYVHVCGLAMIQCKCDYLLCCINIIVHVLLLVVVNKLFSFLFLLSSLSVGLSIER